MLFKATALIIIGISTILMIPSVNLFAEGFVHYSRFQNLHDTIDADTNAIATFNNTFGYLTFGANYDNNTSFFGRNGGFRFPYLSSDITYYSNNGLWFSFTGFKLIGSGKFAEGVDFSGGWTFDVNDHMDGGVSYSRFVPLQSNSVLVQSTASSVLNSYLGLDWNYLYTSVGLTYLFGGNNDYFLTISNSRYFGAKNLLMNDDILSLEPRLSLVSGTQNFALAYNSKFQNDITEGNETRRAFLKREHDRFKFINMEIRFPFSYSFGKYTFEFAYAYTIPFNLVEGDPSYSQSLVTLSFYYTIGVPKKLKLKFL